MTEQTESAKADQAEQEAATAEHEHTCEVFELEYDEKDILYYLVDEEGNDVGFVLPGENGEELEYYYATEEEAAELESEKAAAKPKANGEALFSKEEVKAATAGINGIYKEGPETVGELKEVYDDIKGMLDFKSFLK